MDCLTGFDAPTLSELEAGRYWVVAALDYELGYQFEPAGAPPAWSSQGARPLARFWRFERCIALTAVEAAAWLSKETADQPAGVCEITRAWTQSEHAAAVERIRDYIAAGDCYQVNLTFPLNFQWFGHPLALYARLRAQQPVRYGGFVGNAEGGIVSLSPELFLEKKGAHLLTRPMKGTAPRSVDAGVLRGSVKDRAENLMIVDLLRNDLGRVAENGSVKVESLFEIEAYPTVWQMVSEISAQVPGQGLETILPALFPCGSITGAPKIRAMQIAAELEQRPRGLYTGALGWIAPSGDFRLNVAIRSLELAADGSGKLGIGGGIVADSSADAEWRECLLKARFLTECDPGFKLIETLRREKGAYPRLDGHLARLRDSAERLGFPLDEASVLRHLQEVSAHGVWRVRLTLDKAGLIDVQAFPLPAEPASPRFARLSTVPVDSGNLLRRYKTTARKIYDEALAGLPVDSPVFDIIFLNERGELAEGARSTIFVERNGLLLTPPLSSGALPGVLRAALLRAGRAREAVLWPADLEDGFWLGNALRGLIRVDLDEKKPAGSRLCDDAA